MWTSSLTDQRYKLKAVLLIPSLFPFYASEVLLPKHYLQVNSVVMTASQRTQTHGWYQEWSEKAGSKIRFGICITYYLACSKNLSCVRMWDLGQNGDPLAKTFTDGEVGQCSYGAVIQAY